ncbi:hypothetical protein INT48_004253 [Thamnidium elegans]|uniref:F-box domain-containing protein n=1 Tax=Thamnidium elegans TaxID=101142 RepID=A0A8H7SQK9_9FUNG|nr:hypothetical protein INT48_004253 [Thamnidium elegans]
MSSCHLFFLPSEIIWKIIQLLDPIDLSNTRQSCKRLRTYCDHPSNWTTITLAPSPSSGALDLWNLSTLQFILQPHLALIKTIKIWGVRDNIIRYLLTSCSCLENLTICSWITLSDHAFSKQLTIPLSLRTLRLNGQQHFTSLDAATFAKLISNCPRLEEVYVTNCKIHIQAEALLDGVSLGGESLKLLVVATKRTWSSYHVTRLFQVCSSLKYLALLSGSSDTVDLSLSGRMYHMPSVLEKDVQYIQEREIKEFDNIIVYST